MGGVLVVALVLAGCGTPVSPARAARDWMQQSNFATNRLEVVSVVHHAQTALRSPASTALAFHTICSVLIEDVSQLNASLPTPDAQATAQLSTAYDTLGNGANTCYSAAENSSRRRQALAFLRTGLADLLFATIRLHVAAGLGSS